MVWRAMGTVICETLATRGVTITSGLARGIDGVAHKSCLTGKWRQHCCIGEWT